ncbi:MAG: triose-phosphate isomerase [Proteobacteria bacterium]|nr:triose-phosphate isomerase [Pseudomonadota bacterium]
MRKKLIAGNWKMNGSTSGIRELLKELTSFCSEKADAEVVVFPPFVYLDVVKHSLQGTVIHWGGQNVSHHAAGAFTGEIAVSMLQDLGCRYVIVGHSERRTYCGETDELVAAKFVAALGQQMSPILCVGETASEREQGKTLQVVERQLAVVLRLADNLPNLTQAVIAYEPVWAIGTGLNATPEQAQEVHQAIRAQLNRTSSDLAAAVRILYGGSVKADNAAELFNQKDIDGALVGGASLIAKQFIEIIQKCK